MTMTYDKLFIYSLMAFVVTYPFYFAPSGGPQISLIFLLSAVFCWFMRADIQRVWQDLTVKLIVLFVGYSFIINGYNAYVYGTLSVVKYSVHYLFIGSLAIAVMDMIARNEKILEYFHKAFLTSVAIQAASSLLFMPEVEHRFILFFNNPNQLGYFALLALMTFMILRFKFGIGKKSFYWSFILSFYLIMLSVSKGAIWGLLVLLPIWVVYFILLKQYKSAILIVLAALFTVTFSLGVMELHRTSAFDLTGANSQTLDSQKNTLIERTLNRKVERDETLFQRGYVRMIEHPSYLIFGAGDGLKTRFSLDKEFHSTVGALMFNYGLVGTFLLLMFCLKIYRVDPKVFVIYLLPLAPYSMTHNGLRSPFLILLLVLLLAQGITDKDSIKSPKEN